MEITGFLGSHGDGGNGKKNEVMDTKDRYGTETTFPNLIQTTREEIGLLTKVDSLLLPRRRRRSEKGGQKKEAKEEVRG